MTRKNRTAIFTRFRDVVATVVDPSKAMEDKRDREKFEHSMRHTLDNNLMSRARPGPDPFGNPGRGGYRVKSNAPHGGEDFIEVEGEDFNSIAWAETRDGERYVDVAGNPVAVVGPKDELKDFLGRVGDNYLANGRRYTSDDRRTDLLYQDHHVPEYPVWVHAAPFRPMSYTRRFKVYNTNWMLLRQGIESASDVVDVSVGAKNPVDTSLLVSGLTTAADLKGTADEFAGGDDSFATIKTSQPIFALTFSAIEQDGNGVRLETNQKITTNIVETEAKQRDGEQDHRFVQSKLDGKLSDDQRARLRAFDPRGWTQWLPRELEHRLPGWMEVPGPDPDEITAMIEIIIQEFIQTYSDAPRDRATLQRVPVDAYKDKPFPKLRQVKTEARYYTLPAVRISEARSAIEELLDSA